MHARRAAARRSEAFLASTTREVHADRRAIDGPRAPRSSTGRRLDAAEAGRPALPGSRESHDELGIALLTVADPHASSATGRSSSRRPRSPRPLRERHEELLVHTGQHYDDELSRVFFDELGVPAPDRELDAGGGSNTEQTARMLAALEGEIGDAAPGRGARLRRHELDARRRARGRAGARPGRARRGRDALVRPRDARGAQPRPHRPRQRPAALLDRDRGGQPAARGRRGRGAARRRRDGRRVARLPSRRRASAPTALDRYGARAGRLPARDRPPRRQRRRPGAAAAARRPARGAARAGRPAAAPAHRARGSRTAGLRDRLERRRRRAAAAARLPRLHRARAARARRAHRLRRRAEGGLPARASRA